MAQEDRPVYASDSFFTLTIAGQIGLAALSLILGGLIIAIYVRLAGRIPHWSMRIVLALLIFWAFAWLSPQIYYGYYLLIIDGLPVQWVVRRPPGPAELLSLMTFQGPGTLSAHGQGGLGWLLLGAAAVVTLRKCRNAAN